MKLPIREDEGAKAKHVVSPGGKSGCSHESWTADPGSGRPMRPNQGEAETSSQGDVCPEGGEREWQNSDHQRDGDPPEHQAVTEYACDLNEACCHEADHRQLKAEVKKRLHLSTRIPPFDSHGQWRWCLRMTRSSVVMEINRFSKLLPPRGQSSFLKCSKSSATHASFPNTQASCPGPTSKASPGPIVTSSPSAPWTII